MSKIAAIEFCVKNNCYVRIFTNVIDPNIKEDEVSIIRLEWSNSVDSNFSVAYVSCSEYIKGKPKAKESYGGPNLDVVQISDRYGSSLGITNFQEVLIHPLYNVPSCSRVVLEPTSANDWEILELNALHIEENLLNQVRVVWNGQTLPLWVEGSICIFVNIGETEPHAECVKLEKHTEVIIAPLSRPRKDNVRNKKPDRLSQVSSESLQDNLSLESDTDGKSRPSKISYTPDKASLNEPLQEQKAEVKGADQNLCIDGETGGFPGSHEKAGQLPAAAYANSLFQYASRAWSHIRSFLKSDEPSEETEPDPFPSNPPDEATLFNINSVRFRLRVQPVTDEELMASQPSMETGGASQSAETHNASVHLADIDGGHRSVPESHPSTHEALVHFADIDGDHRSAPESQPPLPSYHDHKCQNKGCLLHAMYTDEQYQSLLAQPLTVFMDKVTFLDHVYEGFPEKEFFIRYTLKPFIFLATMAKMQSPIEKAAEAKVDSKSKKMAEASQRPGAEGRDPALESQKTLEISPSAIVRVVVSDDAVQYLSKDTFFSKGHILVPDIIRRQIGAETASRVKIQAVQGQPNDIAELTLYFLNEKTEEDVTDETVVNGFQQWLASISSVANPLPLNHATLVKFALASEKNENPEVEFLLVICSMQEVVSNTYFLLHPFAARKVPIKVADKSSFLKTVAPGCTLPRSTLSEFDPIVPGYKMRTLGGIKGLTDEAMGHLHISLATRPLAAYLGSQYNFLLQGLGNGGLLITGARGSGKSTIARALCKELSEDPYFCHVEIVNCKMLQGKRVDTIRNMWEEIFKEAEWRQPSVILLEDLDHLIVSPSGPEQENSPDSMYSTRLALALKKLASLYTDCKTRLAVIATCKNKNSLHEYLVGDKGWTLFSQTCLNILPPNQNQRKQILESILQCKTEADLRSLDNVDLDSLAGKLEGYLPIDLNMVVDRAIMSGYKTLMENSQESLDLENNQHETESVLLCEGDFDVALDNFTPLSLMGLKLHKPGDIGWEHVGGLAEVKEVLKESLELPIKHAELFKKLPINLKAGVLLYGPPGVGKTMLAKATARECQVNFISIKGPELLSKYIGASEQAIRDLFVRAEAAKPCILFFDEFDAIAPRRGHDSTGVTDRVVNQLLTQMDGVDTLESVFVLGATSRPDMIDPALLRSGRIDKSIYCGMPTKEERLEILQCLSRKLPLAEDVDLGEVAGLCQQFSGADLKAVLYTAQVEAAHTYLREAKKMKSVMELQRPRGFQSEVGTGAQWGQPGTKRPGGEDGGGVVGGEFGHVDAASTGGWQKKEGEEKGQAVFGAGAGGKMGRGGDGENVEEESEEKGDGLATGGESTQNLEGSEIVRQGAEGGGEGTAVGDGGGLMEKTPASVLEKWKSLGGLDVNEAKGGGDRGVSVEGAVNARKGETKEQLLQKVVYVPSLREGPVPLTPEQEDEMARELREMEEEYINRLYAKRGIKRKEKEREKKNRVKAKITQENLLAAVSKTEPSVSPSERARYKKIYETYEESRGGSFVQTKEFSKKLATHA